MPLESISFNSASHAIVTICATEDVTTAIAAACADAPGFRLAGQFESYVSGDTRSPLLSAAPTAPGTIAVVDCDRDPELALETMKRLRQMGLKRLSIIGVSVELADGYLLRAMRAGCNEFLTKPLHSAPLQDALLALQRAQAAEGADPSEAGRVLSIFGVKGGVGTTTLAVHLASLLAAQEPKRVLLIDHHYELGHVALHLGMKDGQYHFNDLIRNVSRLDSDLLNGLVAKHSSGMDVLSSPDTCSPPCPANAEDVNLVFRFLRRQYDFVVVDSSMSYIDVAPAILQASDEAYLVSTADIASLRDLARRKERVGQVAGMAAKLRIVINRSTSTDAVSPERIAAAIQAPVWLSVPNHYTELQRAINTGEPIARKDRSAFMQSMTKWADMLLGDAKPPMPNAAAPAKKLLFWRSQPSAS